MPERFFTLSPDLLCIANFDGYLQRLNPAWEKTLGFQQEELLNKPYLDFVHPEDREATISEAKKLETGVESISFENRYLCKDGSYKWLLWKTAASVEERLLYAVGRDITERKKAEETLLLTQKRLQHLLSYSPAVIYTCQIEGNFGTTFISDNITTMMGYEPEEFLQDSSFWASHIHPEDFNRVLAGISHLLENGLHSEEYRFQYKDGNYRWVYDELKLVRNEAGNILEIVGCWQDISDRKTTEIALKENEERWQLALRGANDGIWDWNLQTNEVFFSARWKEMLGYAEDEVENNLNGWSSLVHPDDINIAIQLVQDHLAKKTQFYVCEQRLLCKNGSYKWILSRAQALWDETGAPLRLIGSHTDMSERKQMEEALKKGKEELEIRVEERTAELTETLEKLEAEIGERKKVETALRESESRLNSILNSLQDVVWSFSAIDFQMLYLNPAGEKLYGRPNQDFFDNSQLWVEVIHPQDRDRTIQGHQQLMQTGSREIQYRIIQPDGEVRWVHDRAWLIYDQNNQPIRLYGIASDITHAKQVELALQNSEAQYRRIVETCTEGIWTIDPDGNTTFVNFQMATMLGYSPEEMLGKNLLDFMDEEGKAICQRYLELRSQGISENHDFKFRRQDGKDLWAIVSTNSILDPDGKYTGALAMITDITERKVTEETLQQREEQLRHVIQNMPVMMDAFDDWGNIIIWNRECEQVTGYTAAEIIGNSQAMELVYPDPNYRTEMMELWSKLGNNYRNWEWNITAKDGTIKTIAWSNISEQFPIPGWAMWGIGVDVTERKQAEENLRQKAAEMSAIFQAFPDLYFRINTDGLILDYMAGKSNKLYVPPETFWGKEMQEVLPIQVANKFQNAILTVGQNQSLVTIEYSLPMPECECFYEARLLPLLENQIIVIIRDITDRKQAEAALIESENRFRKLAQKEALINRLSGDIRKSLNIHTVLQTTVQEISNLLLLDRCFFSWYEVKNEPNWKIVNEVKKTGLPSILGEYPAKINRGVEKLLNLAIIRDEDLQNNPDPEKQLIYTDWGFTAILSLPIQTLSGKIGILNCAQHSHPRQWNNDELELLQAVCDQLAIALSQAELYHQTENSALLAREKAQELQQTLHQLQQTQTQLIQSEKMSSLGQLVAGVAHEINNPVNFIYGNIIHANEYIEDLLDLVNLYDQHYPNSSPEIEDKKEEIDLNFLIEDLPKILSSMKMGAERIRSIVLSLRNFSRLDEADMKAVDIHEGIENTLLILQNRLKSKPYHPNILIIKDYGKLPLIECYAGQLNQVFMNIINNAIDALEAWENPQPTIRISTEILAGNRVVIRIADNGQGMSEAVKNRLFDPFFTTKSVGKGTGLGLSISYQIVVEKHGGILKCISSPGQGAEFWIEIPISPGKS